MRSTWILRSTIPLLATLSAVGIVQAQTGRTYNLKIDPKTSLAWWQVNPHLSHLWATTCPGDPSWRPGEGRSLAWAGEFMAKHSKTGHAAVMDTIIPLYPRRRVRPLCPDGVTGNITASDTSAWRGVRGLVTVKGDALVTGLDMRDAYAKKTVLKTQTYPNIQFTIDSLNPSEVRGDTLRGTVYGQFIAYERPRPMSAPFRAWHEGGGLRVQSQFMIVAQDLINFYGLSQLTMGLGVGGLIWRELHMGVDVVLVPAEGS